MKNALYLLLLLPLVLFSCDKNTPALVPELVKAESLMQTNADSALSILSTMPVPANKAQYATWCLLLTQAQDKNYIRHTSDSLIQVALHYFKKQPDLRRQATALYYAGRVQNDLNNKIEATEYYVQAFDRAEQVKDYHLMALISNYLGILYCQMNLKDRALEQQFLSYKSDSLAGDTIGVLYSLREIGTCYLHLGKLDSALTYYQNALDLSGQMGDTLAGALLNNIAVVYREQKQLDQSIVYFRKAIEKTTKQTNLYATYSALGSAYLKQHQLDSANYYLLESTQRQNYYTKAGSYMRLYDLEKLRDNYKQATVYNDLYLQYRDSVENIELKKSVAEIESKYNYEKQQNAIKNLKLKKNQQAWNYTYLVFGLLCAIILIYFLYSNRLNQKKKEIQRQKEELRMYAMQLLTNKEVIETNQALISSMTKDVEKQQQENEVLEKQRQGNDILQQRNQGLIEQNRTEMLTLQQKNEALLLENEVLRSEISRSEEVLNQKKTNEDEIQKMAHAKKYLIQLEVYRALRSALQDPTLNPLLLCVDKKTVYDKKNWEEIIMAIDDIYDGLIMQLRVNFPKLSDEYILACSLLLINLTKTDIATLTGEGLDAIRKRVERLASKIGVTKGKDIISFLLGELRVQMSYTAKKEKTKKFINR